MQDVLMHSAPPGSKGICTDNGWINGEAAFLTWLTWFVDFIRPTATKKVLLLLDNHEATNTIQHCSCLKKSCDNVVLCSTYYICSH